MTENFSKPTKQSETVSTLKYLLGLLKKVELFVETYVVLIGAILLMLWLIEPIRIYLTNNLHISQETIVTIIGLFLFVFWRLFVEFDSKLNSLSLQVNEITRSTASDYLIPGGLKNVYVKLEDVIEECLSKPRATTDKCTYENLGLTLLTSWPQIYRHLIDPDFSRWDIRLYCLSPNFIQSNEDTILPYWEQEVNDKIEEIKRYVKNNATSLQSRHLSLSLVSYSHFPAVHGFRINDADILFSSIDWNSSSGNRVAEPIQPRHFYQFVSASNTSLSAHHYRLLFKSWIDRADKTGNKILST